ncbi:hypothetical protein F5884DRAFT_873614 [Xylogone sp. PMI_703]|nr:hypothetical protein F5884DRAFT_873614 [Xylogone sp. PMI_703]
MAKRKRNSTPSSQLWEIEDAVELIAWLNHTIQHDELNFDITILEHLRKSRNREFTLKQVRSKLSGLWNRYGSNELPDKKWNELFNQGSSILTGLNREVVQSIEERLSRLEANFCALEHRTRRTRRLESSIKRESRSTSTIRTDEDNRAKSTPRPLPFREQSNSKTSSFSVQIVTNSKLAKIALAAAPQKDTFEQQSEISTEIASTDDVDVKQHTVRERQSIVNDSEESNSDQETVCIKCPNNRDTNCIDKSDCAIVTTQHQKQRSSSQTIDKLSLESSHRLQLEDALATIEELKDSLNEKNNELLGKQRIIDRIREKIVMISTAQKQRDRNSGGTYEQLIEDKDQLIRKLEGQLRDRIALGSFTKIGTNHERFEKESVTGSFKDAYFYGHQFTVRHNTVKRFTIPELDKYPELKSFIYEALDINMNIQELSQEHIKNALSELNPQVIMRAVVGSAIRSLVYETDFPSFDLQPSKLLETYRKQLINQDGAIALRNLELSSYHAIIETKEFRDNFISKTAEPLAIRLSQILAPLFTKPPKASRESSYDGFETWEEKRQDWKERQRQFVTMFQKALTAKADSLLNIENYEMVIHRPGTPFNPETMTAETMEGTPIFLQDLGDIKDAQIEICVQPALYSHPKIPLTDESPMGEALIQRRNFIRTDREHRSSLRPVVKAVVALKIPRH